MSPLPPLGFKSFAIPYTLEGNYFSIATVTVPSGGASTVTFAGIPSGYKHLQVRALSRDGGTSTYNSGGKIRFNGDTGSNYSNHELYGIGSGTPGNDVPSGANPWNGINFISGSAQMGANVFEILDYASITKNKTVRHLGGTDNNGAGVIVLESGCWLNTSAISSISINFDGGQSFAQFSQFALYGVK